MVFHVTPKHESLQCPKDSARSVPLPHNFSAPSPPTLPLAQAAPAKSSHIGFLTGPQMEHAWVCTIHAPETQTCTHPRAFVFAASLPGILFTQIPAWLAPSLHQLSAQMSPLQTALSCSYLMPYFQSIHYYKVTFCVFFSPEHLLPKSVSANQAQVKRPGNKCWLTEFNPSSNN